jgi:DNA-binding SARP family transcriptional activator
VSEAPENEREPDLRAYCLGNFELWLGHSLITQWAGTKSKSLLKLMLAAFPSQVPATSLMDAMWPGVEEDLARQRLHTAISELRRVLRTTQPEAGNLIISQGGCYGIDPQARIWIDTLEFERARRAGEQYEQIGRMDLAADSLRAAVAIYRGEFLEEDIFADWPLEQRERLKSDYLTLLTRLGQWAFSAGDYDACLRWGRMTLECDPCREDAHRLLMRGYSRMGQRAMALRQYRQCVDALRRELDALPEAESDALYRLLQQGQEI